MKEGYEIRAWSKEDDQLLRTMWEAERTIREIAAALNRAESTVYARRWHLNLPTKHKRITAMLNDPEFQRRFRDLYESGTSLRAIKERMGIDLFLIYRLIATLQLPRRRPGACMRGRKRINPRKYSEQVIEQIRTMRAAKTCVQDIADKTGLTYDAVSSICWRYKIVEGARRFWTHQEDERMKEMFDTGASAKAVAQALDRTLTSVKARCDKLGITHGLPAVISIPAQRKRTLTIRQALRYKLTSIKSRGIHACDIDIDYLLSLHSSQHGRCYYTGLPLVGAQCDPNTVSIDRIDSTRGYMRGNVVLCIWDANLMKQSLTVERFRELCALVAAHSSSRSLPVAA